MFDFVSDEKYLKMKYRIMTGEPLNLENPQTFNEKLQWLKFHDHRCTYTTMVDKYEAKKFVAEKIGGEYIIPTLGVWDKFDEIDFDSLPEQFVLKTTHDSGGVVICKDRNKFDADAAMQKLEKSLKRNFYLQGREWPYKNVKPRLMAEEYMQNLGEESLNDYKIFCFDGEPKLIQVDYDRFTDHKRNFYDVDWRIIDAEFQYRSNKNHDIERPVALDEMLECAKRLSKGVPFLRTDFYCIDDKIYFGELTFYPESGFGKFSPESLGVEMGEWVKLPSESAGID